jgi:hypothetical protein
MEGMPAIAIPFEAFCTASTTPKPTAALWAKKGGVFHTCDRTGQVETIDLHAASVYAAACHHLKIAPSDVGRLLEMTPTPAMLMGAHDIMARYFMAHIEHRTQFMARYAPKDAAGYAAILGECLYPRPTSNYHELGLGLIAVGVSERIDVLQGR